MTNNEINYGSTPTGGQLLNNPMANNDREQIAKEICRLFGNNHCTESCDKCHYVVEQRYLIIVDYVLLKRQEAYEEGQKSILPVPIDADYFKVEIEKARKQAIIETVEKIKTDLWEIQMIKGSGHEYISAQRDALESIEKHLSKLIQEANN